MKIFHLSSFFVILISCAAANLSAALLKPGDILLSDAGFDKIHIVDDKTGAQSELDISGLLGVLGYGGINLDTKLIVGPDGHVLILDDSALHRMDPATGAVSNICCNYLGLGASIGYYAMALDNNDDLLIAALTNELNNSGYRETYFVLIRYELSTDTETIVAKTNGIDNCESFAGMLEDIVVTKNGKIFGLCRTTYIGQNQPTIIEINPTTGVVSPFFYLPNDPVYIGSVDSIGMALDNNDNLIVALSRGLHLEISSINGAILNKHSFPVFYGLAVDRNGKYLFSSCAGNCWGLTGAYGYIGRYDPTTSSYNLVSSGGNYSTRNLGEIAVAPCIPALIGNDTNNYCPGIIDTDGDGIPDQSDNCLSVTNPNQANYDGDALGNACDQDDDNDGMPDTYETSKGLNPLNESDASTDPDGDGYTNLEEYEAGTDPHDPESFPKAGFMPWLPLLLD